MLIPRQRRLNNSFEKPLLIVIKPWEIILKLSPLQIRYCARKYKFQG